VRLDLMAHQRQPRAVTLNRLVANPNRLLGTLLIGNNVANYASSLGITALLTAAGFGDAGIIVVTALILTPLLFVFGEVLPKDLFQNYTDRITYRFATFLKWNQRLVVGCGLLPLIDVTNALLSRRFGHGRRAQLRVHPRRVVTQLMKEGVGEGLISPYQSDMIDRVLHPTESTVFDAMVPWSAVQTIGAYVPPEAVWAAANRTAHARLPMIDRHGRPTGVLQVFDVLLHEPQHCPPIATLARPAPRLTPRQTLADGLAALRTAGSAMGIVQDDSGRPMGIVTAKDLVEPITGDLEVW
jgi:CBS domain containing-hemolysin-like protein